MDFEEMVLHMRNEECLTILEIAKALKVSMYEVISILRNNRDPLISFD